MKVKFMPTIKDYPKELDISIEDGKNGKVVDDIIGLISEALKDQGFDDFVLPETRVILKNGTAVGRIENNEFDIFSRHKGSRLNNKDKIAIIFPVNGG